MSSLPIKIFLVQPFNPAFKEMIVYADNEQEARQAAGLMSKAATQEHFSEDNVYDNTELSICIQTDNPQILKQDTATKHVTVQYNEVLYDLTKNQAQEVIAVKIL